MTAHDLKPCPFCGGEARIETVNHDYGVSYSVGCFGSGRCGANFTLFDHRNDAIATWNRRDIVAAPIEGEWRTISASDVDWRTGVDRYSRKPRALYQLCSVDHNGEWAGLTLGQIADMGEYNWIRAPGVGKLAVTIIKSVIDMAAEGKRVTRGPFPEPYIPTCERGEP